jgi:hypothetical protein
LASNNYHIEVTFPESERELYNWVRQNGKSNYAYFGRLAFATLQLFGSLEAAQACQRREAAYAAFVAGEWTRAELEEALKDE